MTVLVLQVRVMIDESRQHTEGLLTDLLLSSVVLSLLCCTLVRRDLNNMNILVDWNEHITGVVDWEYQIIHPTLLVADYPPWLLYDGCNDPHFVDSEEVFWSDSPKESEWLCDLYLKASQVLYMDGRK